MLDRHALPGRRDMAVEDAIELGRRAIYHATFRDAVSGGTVSGELCMQVPALVEPACMQRPDSGVSSGAQCTM